MYIFSEVQKESRGIDIRKDGEIGKPADAYQYLGTRTRVGQVTSSANATTQGRGATETTKQTQTKRGV